MIKLLFLLLLLPFTSQASPAYCTDTLTGNVYTSDEVKTAELNPIQKKVCALAAKDCYSAFNDSICDGSYSKNFNFIPLFEFPIPSPHIEPAITDYHFSVPDKLKTSRCKSPFWSRGLIQDSSDSSFTAVGGYFSDTEGCIHKATLKQTPPNAIDLLNETDPTKGPLLGDYKLEYSYQPSGYKKTKSLDNPSDPDSSFTVKRERYGPQTKDIEIFIKDTTDPTIIMDDFALVITDYDNFMDIIKLDDNYLPDYNEIHLSASFKDKNGSSILDEGGTEMSYNFKRLTPTMHPLINNYWYQNPSTNVPINATSIKYTATDSSGNIAHSEREIFQPTQFQVNTYTTNMQSEPSITALTDGGFVVTWQSYGQDGDRSGIYAQRYDSMATTVGSEFRVNTYTTNMQSEPSITALTDDGFVVTWQSYGQDGSRYGIYAQRYDANGIASGSEFQVNTYTTNSQNSPSITALADGGFVVTWQSWGQDGVGWGIYAQRYDASGNANGAEFQVNTYTSNSQFSPSTTALTDGGFVVTWQSYYQDGSYEGIYAQIYGTNGIASGVEFRVNTYTDGMQIFPAITGLPNGGFVVAWTSQTSPLSGFYIVAQHYSASGAPVGSTTTISDNGDPHKASITTIGLTGKYILAWQQSAMVNLRTMSRTGDIIDTIRIANSSTSSSIAYPIITSLTSRAIMVTWTGNNESTGTLEVYARGYRK